jgi:hypothetical protein
MTKHCLRAPTLIASLEKVCEGPLHLRKERNKLVNQGKWLKETQLVVGLVSNSSFLNRDIGIMRFMILNFGKQIILSSSSVYLPLYSLVLNRASALYCVMCSIVQ